MRGGFIAMTMLLVGASAAGAAPANSETRRIAEAASVINELRSAPDNGHSREHLGSGPMCCRDA